MPDASQAPADAAPDDDPASDAGMRRRIHQALADRFGEEAAREAVLDRRGGHASLRIYWRIELPTAPAGGAYPRGDRAVRALVRPEPGLPESDDAVTQGDARDVADGWPFVNVQRYLRRIGMAVPDVDHVDADGGVLLIEDLGEETFEEAVLAAAGAERTPGGPPPGPFSGPDVYALYREVIDMVLKLHRAACRSEENPTFGDARRCIAFERSFDRDLLRWELDHYREWGLHARVGEETVRPHEETLADAFDRLTDELLALPQTLALRDLQSRNIMRKAGRWYLIDFQDALLGSFVYDLVALLRDSYVVLDDAMVEDLLYYYSSEGERSELPWCENADAVRRAFHLQTVQRKLKDAGRFIFIEREKGKDEFLPYYDASVGYAQRALAHLPGFADLHEALSEIEPAFE